MVVAKEWSNAGEGYIYSFIMNKDAKALSDLIHTTRKVENAAYVQERASQSQMEVLQQHLNESCVEIWTDSWLHMQKKF